MSQVATNPPHESGLGVNNRFDSSDLNSKALNQSEDNVNDSSKDNEPIDSTTSVLSWIGQFLKPYRWRVVAAVIFLFIGSIAWLSIGQGVRLLVDEGFLQDNADRLNEITLLVVVIISISSTAVFCRFYLMTWLGERVSNDIRRQVYDHLLKLSPGFYAKLRTGEVISRFTADSTLLQSVVGSSLSMALKSSVTAIGGTIMMAVTSIKMTAVVMLLVPLVLLPIFFFGRKVRFFSRKSQDRVGDLGAYVDETLHEIHTVQSYTHETRDRALFNEHVEDIMEAAKGRIFYRAILIGLVMLLSILAITMIIWVGAQDVVSGNISGGELSAFVFYAVIVASAVATISEVIGEIQKAVGASERLIELIEAPVDIPTVKSPLMLSDKVSGKLTLSDVRFSYHDIDPNTKEDSSQEVICGINVEIKPGEVVALVGESGAGKSTLFELLQRFFDIDSGTICLDDIDISQLNPQQLRQQFALVPQDSVIFAMNVFDNVRYGNLGASEQEVINACKAAKADEFISEFSDGYHTYLGERGVRLSGGQKQRIAIARAILANRPILLLDEATSALDAVSERKVKQALERLMHNKTTIIIAHRLATVLNADRILVLDKGQIIASGTHQQLMETSEHYREFAELQLFAAH